MSRIFSALQKMDEAMTDAMIRPLEPRNEVELRREVEPRREVMESAVLLLSEEPSPAEPAMAAGGVLDLLKTQSDYRTVSLRLKQGPLCPFDGTDPRTAEQYRLIRTSLLLHSARPRMIAVSSASPGDGKTVTTVNLAGTLALKMESTVLIVDGDMRQCKIAASLGIPEAPGLADVLRGTCSLDEAIVRIAEIPNLLVLPSGRATSNPAELLDSPRWKAISTMLRAHFSYVIIDTTPVAAVADFQLVQEASDGVLLVLRPDHTRRSNFQKALATVPREKLLGTVLNAVPEWFLWNTRENDYYYVESEHRKPVSPAERQTR